MLRFSIRDTLWLTAIVGLALAWWADGVKLRHDRRRAEQDAADYWSENLPPESALKLVKKYSAPQYRRSR